MSDTFDEAEAKQIVAVAEHYNEQFEVEVEEGIDASVMYEASLLSAALFCCGTDLTDEEISESFADALRDARRMLADA